MAKPRNLWFIDRGHPRPECHKAPYHRYLICSNPHQAAWEADWSGQGAWVWVRSSARGIGGEGWLLLRWAGLDIDYGHLVRGLTLPDGTNAGFSHPGRGAAPWNLLNLAVWWSTAELPVWLAEVGVAHPEDEFSLQRITAPVQPYRGRKKHYVFPGEEVLQLADWLEERGHEAAAADMRATFGPRREPTLFDPGPEADPR